MNNNSTADTPASYFTAQDIDAFERKSASAESAFDSFDDNSNQIINNTNGGAGYYAETHHAASFNVNQANADTDDYAELLNSRDFGSIDIQTHSGMSFNPKYYATADQTYSAGAELVIDEEGMMAKYANQQVIVPSDQLDSVLSMHQQQLNEALLSGQTDKYEALSSINFSDRVICDNGISSTPLSYQEAKEATYDFQQGIMPDYAYQTSAIESSSAIIGSGALAVGMVTAVELAPAMLVVFNRLKNNEISLSDSANTLIGELKDRRVTDRIKQSTAKIGTAGGLTFFTDINAGIATFLVTFGWDVCQLYGQYQNQEISQFELIQRIKLAGMDRGVMSILTYSAFAAAGPIGLLVPVVMQWLVPNIQEKRWFGHGLNDVLHGWMRTVNETTQYKSEQWQLAYNLDSNYLEHIEENAAMVKQKRDQLDDNVQNFNQIVTEDDFAFDAEPMNTEAKITQLERLQKHNLLLLSKKIDSLEVNQAVQRFMIEHSNNSRVFEAAAIDAMAILDSTDNTDAKTLSLLSKLKLSVLPQSKLQQQSERICTLMTGQIAAMRMLQSLQNDQTMSLEFITLLQQRMSQMADEIANTQVDQMDSVKQTYESIALVYGKLRSKIVEQTQRIDTLEKNVKLHEWLNLINVRRDNGKSLLQLEFFERLTIIINDFIRLTEGRWTQRDLLILEEMLHRTHLVTIDTSQYITALSTDNALSSLLFKQLKLVHQINELDNVPLVNELSQLYLTQSTHNNRNNYLSTTLPIPTAIPSNDASVWQLVLMLLWGINAAGITPYRIQAMEVQKRQWLKAIDKLDALIEQGVLSTWLSTCTKQLNSDIQNFKLVVPIIGKYSVGKSTLLNAWLEREIQPINLAACTSIPTEFHFASSLEHEKLIITVLGDNNKIVEECYPLADYELIVSGQLSLPPNLQHFELHLHSPALALHPDLVLVDTPGLESNIGSHEMALAQYSGSANSSFILCVSRSHLGEAEKQFVTRQYMFGKPVSLLICQEDLIPTAEILEVRQTIAIQAEIDEEYGLVRGCSAKENDLKGLIDILNYIEEQKTQLFESKFSESMVELLALADQDLAQQLASDDTHEQLAQKKQDILLIQQELKQQYDYEKRKLFAAAKGSLSNQVRQNINQALTSQFDHYCQIMGSNPDKFQSILHADIQNTFELSIEQLVHPEIQQAAHNLQSAVSIKQQQLNKNYALVPHGITEQSSDKFLFLGGVAGAGVSLLAGAAIMTTAIITVPAGIVGWVIGNAYQENKSKNTVKQQLEKVQNELSFSIPTDIVAIVEAAIEQIHDSIQKKLQSEADKLNAVDEQLELDAQTKADLNAKLTQCKAEIKQLMTQNNRRSNVMIAETQHGI